MQYSYGSKLYISAYTGIGSSDENLSFEVAFPENTIFANIFSKTFFKTGFYRDKSNLEYMR